ncbi:MAG: outer membrane protein assembly factor BamA [Spirochaetes bacterium]|nr:outer membrane protein assembly factor BamA [Spirochaetota bacterium]
MRPFTERSTGARTAALVLAAAMALLSAAPARAMPAKDVPSARYNGAAVGSITVRFHDFNDRENINEWTDTARKALQLREGDPFSAALLEDSKKSLAMLKRFSSIQTDIRLDGGKVALDFSLTPYRFIRNIVIRGNGAVLESEISSTMTIHAGEAFQPERLPEQERLVREKFIAEGFIDPAVTARAKRSGRDGNYTVYVTIRPGAYYSYGDITVEGNRAYPDAAIRLRLFSETFRFIESEFRNNISLLRKQYWNQGYPEAEIRYTINRDRAAGLADIDITISEGRKYRVRFTGNRRFRDITLRKSLAFAERGNRNDAGARKSARNIADLYKSKGYPGAQVKVETREAVERGNRRTIVTFVIDEGRRVDVEELRITGNASFGEKRILKLMRTAASGRIIKKIFNPDLLNNDILMIESFYIKNGFREAAVTPRVTMSRDRTKARILIAIAEGPRTLVTAIGFRGNHVIDDKDLRAKIDLAPGAPFQEAAVKSAENRIAMAVSALGYPYVTVRGTASISADRAGAALLFTIDEGKQVRLGNVFFSGNLRTMTSYLKKQISNRPGDPLSVSRMLEEYKNISDMEIFQWVNMATSGLEEKKERADLYIDVLERKPYVFNIGGGYNSEKGFFANTGLEDKNFLGRYKSLWARGEASETGYSAAAGLTEPRLIGPRASATLSFSIEKLKEFNQTFGTIVYGPTLSMKSFWFDGLAAGLGVSYQQRKMIGYLSMGDLGDVDKTGTYHLRRILLFSAALTYDRRDSFIRPRKGFIAAFSADVSVDLTRPKWRLLAADYSDNFIKYHGSLKGYITPLPRLTFAAQAAIGYIQPYTFFKGVISDQLFYLGGIGDVRGFRENMLKRDLFNKAAGGRASFAASVEARIDLGYNFELTGFFDAGRIDNTFHRFFRMRMSAGAGLRYVTPVGPIGLLYGFKINRQRGDDLGMLHLSIGYTF